MHLTGCARDGRGTERERALGRAICMKRIALAAVLLAYPVASVAGPIEDKALVCAACHGSDGLPKDKTIPILWGQNAAYLYLQLRDFEKGERKSELMSPIAHDVVKDDALELAEYFAAKEWPRTNRPRPQRRWRRRRPRSTNRSPAPPVTWISSKAIPPCPGLPGNSATIWSRRSWISGAAPARRRHHVRAHELAHARANPSDCELPCGPLGRSSTRRLSARSPASGSVTAMATIQSKLENGRLARRTHWPSSATWARSIRASREASSSTRVSSLARASSRSSTAWSFASRSSRSTRKPADWSGRRKADRPRITTLRCKSPRLPAAADHRQALEREAQLERQRQVKALKGKKTRRQARRRWPKDRRRRGGLGGDAARRGRRALQPLANGAQAARFRLERADRELVADEEPAFGKLPLR